MKSVILLQCSLWDVTILKRPKLSPLKQIYSQRHLFGPGAACGDIFNCLLKSMLNYYAQENRGKITCWLLCDSLSSDIKHPASPCRQKHCGLALSVSTDENPTQRALHVRSCIFRIFNWLHASALPRQQHLGCNLPRCRTSQQEPQSNWMEWEGMI